jgi:hypothetical protein
MPAIQSKNGGTTREVGEMMQRFRNEVEHNPLLPQSGRTSETGSIGLRARHVVRVLSGPPRNSPDLWSQRLCEKSPRWRGLFDALFSLSGLWQAGYAEFGARSLAEKILFLAL